MAIVRITGKIILVQERSFDARAARSAGLELGNLRAPLGARLAARVAR